MNIEIGAVYKFLRPTFLLKGVFVFQGSRVEVTAISGETITLRYLDREGFEHFIEDARAEELAPL